MAIVKKRFSFINIVDLWFVVRSKCHYEKNRCADAIVEAISLLTPFILLIALHFLYVFMLISWSLYRHYLPLFRRSASRTLSLSLHYLALFPSSFVTHKNLFCLSFIAIKSSDKHRCFTQRADHNIKHDSLLCCEVSYFVKRFVYCKNAFQASNAIAY